MAWSLVQNVTAGGTANGVTTPSTDFSAATFIIVNCAWYTGTTPDGTLGDSDGNEYNPLTKMTVESVACRLFWTIPVNPSPMTHSYNGNGIFPSIQVLGFTGNAASPFDAESAGGNSTGSTVQPGSLTPSEDDCLLVTGMVNENNSGGGAGTINGGFTAHAVNYSGGNHLGGGIAYLIQTSAAGANPTWDLTNAVAGGIAAIMASFKAAAGGGPRRFLATRF